jgi:hypothetical protein
MGIADATNNYIACIIGKVATGLGIEGNQSKKCGKAVRQRYLLFLKTVYRICSNV